MLRIIFIQLSFVFSSLFAQNEDFNVSLIHAKTGLPALIQFNQSGNNRPNPENLQSWMRQNLYTNSAFLLKYVHMNSDTNGYKHYRYQQYYGRFKVEAGELILHQKGLKTLSINGKYFPELDLDTSIGISSSEAIQKALLLFPQAVFMWEVLPEEKLLQYIHNRPGASYYPKPELLIISSNDSCRNSDFRLAYKMDVYAYEPRQREWIYIDAKTGEVLDRENQICNIDRVGIAHTKYNGIQNINCDSIGKDSFILLDKTRGRGIHTMNYLNITNDTGLEFRDEDNVWNNVNGFKDEAATDAHWSSEMTYDYYKSIHERNSFDDSDGLILSRIHVGTQFNNAFWDGSSAYYGDGDGLNYDPLTSIEICAHEITHGVTQYTANLRYRNESGALNESFSDILAKCIEDFADPSNFDWYIANKISLDNQPFRDMSFPPNQNHPKYYYGNYYYSGSQDNGGVHTNSGVQNFWFYLLCEGGSGIREDDSMPFTVDKIGFEKAGKIAYGTLKNYLIRESEYIEACSYSILVAAELYGENSFEFNQVQKAWYAVGLLGFDQLKLNNHDNYDHLWKVYPNPGNSPIRIQNPMVYKSAKIEVIDISGKVLHQSELMPNETLNLGHLSDGLYFIRINGVYCTKWLKQ